MKHSDVLNSALRSLIPFQRRMRSIKRRFAPYTDNAANSNLCITNGLQQLVALRAAAVPVPGAVVLEFGTGWLPLIPMLFHVAGASRLILTDVEQLMDDSTIGRAREIVQARIDEVATTIGISREMALARLHENFAPDYIVPWDAARHPAASADIIISRATFEHVPAIPLRDFLAAFLRILRPGGAMCHLVDNSDHWEHRDKRLSRVNFLIYEDGHWLWRLAQMHQQSFQNRLRHSDYIRMFEEAGFIVQSASGEPDARCMSDLARLSLATPFAGRPAEDLAILTSLFVARKPASS